MPHSLPRNVLINLIIMATFFNCVRPGLIEDSEKDSFLRELSGAHLLIAASPVIILDNFF